MGFFKFLLIVAVVLGICFLIYWVWFSVRVKLQTVNFFTGSLGSGKTTIGTRTAIRLRRRSILVKFLFGWIPKLGKRIRVRDIYSNYPILIKKKKKFFKSATTILFTLDFCKRNCLEERFLYRKVEQEDGSVIEVKTKQREGYTWNELKELIDKGLEYSSGDVIEYQLWSFCLSPDHLCEVIRANEYCIIVYDEVSLDFPSLRDKSDPRLTLALHYLRHKLDCILIFMDQSIDCDIAIRRRINIVYNFSDFRKYFWTFFTVTVRRIVYMEDVVVNVNNINDFEDKFYFGMFGHRAFASRYMKYMYYAKPDLERKTWNGMFITESNPGYTDVSSHQAMSSKPWIRSATVSSSETEKKKSPFRPKKF